MGMILDTYGWGLLRKGEKQAALAVLRKSAAILPSHPIVLYHLGAACKANGDHRSARKYLEAALKESNEFSGADAARRLLREAD
jgi:uncharacterized protein HemY